MYVCVCVCVCVCVRERERERERGERERERERERTYLWFTACITAGECGGRVCTGISPRDLCVTISTKCT